MTEERVRELLGEVADAVPPPDVATRAWRGSVRVRRRRAAGGALLAAGSVLAVIGVVGFVTDGAGDVPVAAGDPRPPVDRVAGAPAWIGPTVAEEAGLPRLASALPDAIDLTSVTATDQRPGRAVAAFSAADDLLPDSVVVLGADGRLSRLPLPDLDPVVDNRGRAVPVLNLGSLSPDGTRLVVPQPHGVVVYDLRTGQLDQCSAGGVDTYYAGWSADGEKVLLPNNALDPASCEVTGGGSADDAVAAERIGRFTVERRFWPSRSRGRSDAEAAWALQNAGVAPELTKRALIAVAGPRAALLALPEAADQRGVAPGVRVVGWLDRRTVAFESQASGRFRVLGWDTRSGAVRLVSEVAVPDDWDTGVIASWADLPVGAGAG